MIYTQKVSRKLARKSKLLYTLKQEEVKKLKQCLLEMYLDILEVCEKHNIRVMLGAGSALGAVRHEGFIPWDDDLDLLMPREDYNKFINVFEEELSDLYEITSPNSKYNVSYVFTKIYKKNTTLIEIFDINNDTPKGVYIDIFPIEYIPENKLIRFIKGFFANGIHYIGSSAKMHQIHNIMLKEYFSASLEGKINYIIRNSIGFLASFISYKEWFNFYDKIIAYEKVSDLCGVPSGRAHYFGEILPKDVFLPPKEIKFEGQKAYVPNKVDIYLKNLYGDYMKIPPIESRERHYFVKFEINN